MPLGINSDSEFQKEIDNSRAEFTKNGVSIGIDRDKVIEGIVENQETPGRNNGDNNVPDALRNVIAETALMEGRAAALQVARDFGLSDSSVSAYTAGRTSTASKTEDTGLSAFLSKRKNRISKKASRVILSAIDNITDDKLREAPAAILAGVARNLASVVKDMEPEVTQDKSSNGPQFIIYAPQVVQENHFQSIQLNE